MVVNVSVNGQPAGSAAAMATAANTMTAVNSNGAINLTWVAPDTVPSGFDGWDIRRSTDGINWTQNLNSQIIKGLSYNDFSAVPGLTYFYELIPVDNQDQQLSTPYAMASCVSTANLPPAPTNVTVQVTQSTVDQTFSVQLNWAAVTGISLQDYKVYRYENENSQWQWQLLGTTTGTSFADAGLIGGTYDYRLSTLDQSGHESSFVSISVTTSASPVAPTPNAGPTVSIDQLTDRVTGAVTSTNNLTDFVLTSDQQVYGKIYDPNNEVSWTLSLVPAAGNYLPSGNSASAIVIGCDPKVALY